ncbi:MAG: hypothetical protein J6W52_09505 [Bacteroidaceae bacterium]|nr:hypothetical protein [Bacteroidaceae bacterium]
MDFTKQLVVVYNKKGIQTIEKAVTYVKPIIELDKKKESILLAGDGQSNPDEYKQINSSTGLAVNYYMILNSLGKIEDLTFEDKVAKPLKCNGGLKANIDVSYKRDGKIIYVESKFLEPYYSKNEHLRESYFNKEYYDVPNEDKDAWYKLLKDAQEFKYYNVSQLCRHLMAIWRKHEKDKTPIVLQSVTWSMPDVFIEEMESAKDKEKYKKLKRIIDEEAIKCQSRIREFLIQIDWKNMAFEALHYNDMLEDISSSKYIEEFKRRYFL